MSVVIVALDGFESVREAIRHLRAQSARDRLEIIFVAPSAAAPAPRLLPREVRVVKRHWCRAADVIARVRGPSPPPPATRGVESEGAAGGDEPRADNSSGGYYSRGGDELG
jgi:hypothetical protein